MLSTVASRASLAVFCAGVLTACAHDTEPVVNAAPKAEVRERKKRCDVIQRSLTPDRGAGGGFSVLNFGLRGEYRVDHVNNVKDEYIAAFQGLLLDCREWQRFEITNREWRQARLRFTSVYTSKLDAAAVDQAIVRLSEVFTEGLASQQEQSQAARDELQALKEAQVSDRDALENRLRRLVDEITALRADLKAVGSSESSTPSMQTPIPSNPTPDVRTLPPVLPPEPAILRQQWTLHFAVGDATPDPSQSEVLISELKALAVREPALVFELTGFSDALGDERANLALAVRRVQAVRRVLDNAGIPSASAVAAGETESFGRALSENRIVLISAYRRATVRPTAK
jgi:outer membrane protein OmpA-like peptidoglycan-associated protein